MFVSVDEVTKMDGGGGTGMWWWTQSDAEEPIDFANSNGGLPKREMERCWYVPCYYTVRREERRVPWGNRDWSIATEHLVRMERKPL